MLSTYIRINKYIYIYSSTTHDCCKSKLHSCFVVLLCSTACRDRCFASRSSESRIDKSMPNYEFVQTQAASLLDALGVVLRFDALGRRSRCLPALLFPISLSIIGLFGQLVLLLQVVEVWPGRIENIYIRYLF